jgi:hypothetical protein
MTPEAIIALAQAFAAHDPTLRHACSALRIAAAVLATDAEVARVQSAVFPDLKAHGEALAARAEATHALARALEEIDLTNNTKGPA